MMARLGARLFAYLIAVFLCAFVIVSGAQSAEPVRVSVDDIALDITGAIEPYVRAEGILKISTAPDAEGIVRRIEVRSKREEGTSYWAVFALANTSDQQIDRLIVAPHYRMVGSGIFWPDLDNTRITNITPSEGFTLDRQKDASADVFLITLDPGAVITLIAEQNTQTLPKLFLWEPSAYKDTANSYTLYQGIVLGIAGLLAIFLTILFVVKGSAMFPATAALAWGVLAYICVDFGFWNKIISTPAANDPFWRAGTEVFLSASLVIFVYAYLSLNRWHPRFIHLVIGWILALIILMGVAVFEPSFAAGLARFSMTATVLMGLGLIPYLAFNRYDRAIMLVPTWLLLCAWVIAAAFTVTGQVANDIIQPALSGGLVLIVLLLSFTVLQHAFSGGAFAQGLVSDSERTALALAGTGDVVWDWDINRNLISLGETILPMLNSNRKILNMDPARWHTILHPNDKDRFDATLAAVTEHKRGKISQNFRLRASDGHYHWFKLRARPMLNINGEVARCVGTLSDITDQKKSEERLLHDSIRDHLTGLENREVFTER
ncbi:MAG: PAS domain-containing protein, partial [Pseudomonadota bacterium]